MSVTLAVVWRLLWLLPFMAAGFAIEELNQRRLGLPSSVRFNLAHLVLFWTIHFSVGAIAIGAIQTMTQRLTGAGVVTWPVAHHWWSALAVVCAWLVVHDFFYYWQHRVQHAWGWLWAQHEVHHADEAMNVTTTFRHHWSELLLQSLCVSVPLTYLIVMPVGYTMLLSVLGDAIGHFIHLDAPISLGRWRRVIATPANHRIHHSVRPEHRDKNFAAISPVWDTMFGTYFDPHDSDAPPTGLASGERIQTLWQALIWPLSKWYQAFVEHSR